MGIKGIDISTYQKGMDFAEAKKKGVDFVIIRAGFGGKLDSVADEHVTNCKENDIDIGFYWYSYAKNVEQAKNEALLCVNYLKKHNPPKYGVWYDVEETDIAKEVGRNIATEIIVAFISTIQEAGYPCGIYANPAYFEQFTEKSRLVGKYDIWLAHWTESPTVKSNYDYGQKLWQWGLDKSINGGVDGDLCFVDYPSETAKFYKEHNTPEPPVTPNPKPASSIDNTKIKIGDIVQFKGGNVYGSSDIATATVVKGKSRCKITNVSENGKHPYHLISEDKEGVYGWVNSKDVEENDAVKEDKTEKFEIGDVVKFLGGNQYQASQAETPYGVSASIVKITNIAENTSHPYHVISTDDGSVYGWVDRDKLETINAIDNGMSNKDIEKVALEVIVGLWGNGEERTKRLTEAGYDAEMVQKKVNILLKK